MSHKEYQMDENGSGYEKGWYKIMEINRKHGMPLQISKIRDYVNFSWKKNAYIRRIIYIRLGYYTIIKNRNILFESSGMFIQK